MDERMRLAVGGAATIFVSVAVVCAVAVTNAAALADTSGAPVSFAQVDVPLSTPRPAPSTTPAVIVTTPTIVAADPVATPETLPAPEPEDVAPADSAPAPVVEAPAPEQVPAESSSDQSGTSPAISARTWERLIRWAHSNGWSDAEIARWLANHGSVAEWKALWQATQTPARGAGNPSVSDLWSDDG